MSVFGTLEQWWAENKASIIAELEALLHLKHPKQTRILMGLHGTTVNPPDPHRKGKA